MTTTPESSSGRRARLHTLREAALHRKVLANRLPAAFNGRWSRRHWAHASLFATFGALLAALVPGLSDPAGLRGPASAHTTLALALPTLPLGASRAQPADTWQTVTVEPGQTLGGLFEDLGIPGATLHRLLDQPEVRRDLTRLHPGAVLGFDLRPSGGKPGALHAFRYDRDDTHRVELTLAGDRVVQRVIERPTRTRTVVISGEVGKSLFWSARKLGLPGRTINQLTDDVFKYDIDFNTDVAASDRYSVVVDQVWREGELIHTGDVQAATFTAHGKTYSAFRFDHDGKSEYYDADGRPLKKAFIRMPVSYTRISSRFSNARKHPILGRTRAHQGVDFAAPTGTPVMAAGNARVAFVGWKGGYGRTVILDHGRGYTTLYGHMSRFGKEHVGQRVSQGTLIGYVGQSGLATGPHLHYEFRVNGVHRNPLSVTMPPPEPLSGKALAAFRAQTGEALAKIRQVEDVIYADADAKPARKGGKQA